MLSTSPKPSDVKDNNFILDFQTATSDEDDDHQNDVSKDGIS